MGDASISIDGLYRWALHRELPTLIGNGAVLFIMLNPSTADANQDDPTIRRCLGYASSWGYSDLYVANLYAYRATNPASLNDAADPIGDMNDRYIDALADYADLIVVAWGANVGPVADRAEAVTRRLLADGHDLQALALAANGQPRHPLYCKADLVIEPFDLEVAHG